MRGPVGMEKAGYKFYVYLGPGRIEYFFTRSEAEEYAAKYDAEVKEL